MTITLYAWNTPNGQKPVILLEELELPYELEGIDIGAGDQFSEAFVALNPNSKIPALRDARGQEVVDVFESGAVLYHIANSEGRLLSPSPAQRAQELAWTFWQVGGVGPAMGQWNHFKRAEEQLPYAQERFLSEALRLYEVLEAQLERHEHVAGPDYSIADIAIWPWMGPGIKYLERSAAERLPELSQVRRWSAQIEARPAVGRAMERLKGLKEG